MKKKIYIALFAVFALFSAGALISMLYITNTTNSLSRLVKLHQIEHIRQDLIISVQAVQGDLFMVHTPYARHLDSIVGNVTHLNETANSCSGCHHSPEVAKRLTELKELTEEYQNSLSYYITASADQNRIEKLKLEAAGVGNRLLGTTQDMAITASQKLQKTTAEALVKINNARIILAVTLVAAFLLAFAVSAHLIRSITRPIDELLQAARIIATGNLDHTISYNDKTEFGELASNFNAMSATLKDSYRKLVEREVQLESSIKEWKGTFDSIEDSIAILSPDNIILKANLSTSRLVDMPLDEIIGKPCYEVFHKIDNNYGGCPHMKTLLSRCSEHLVIVEAELMKKILDITTTPIFDRENNITATIHIVKDITDKKNLEEQLIQSQKMESLGLLAGGVAHDFNNLLTAITGYSSLLQQMLGDSDEKTRRYLKHIVDAADRAQNFTSGLLAFSRKQIIKPRSISLNSVIENIIELLKRLVSEDIELRLNLSENEMPFFGDPHQIEQIMINLITNARDAMRKGGVLTIETVMETLDTKSAGRYGMKAGRYVMLAITDTGIGIDKNHIAHIFEPFFTTKEKGKGTGLGLAMVYGIVKQHSGFMDVHSEIGAGTTFHVYFPAIETPEVQEHTEPEKETAQQAFTGSETILVAEDEESVREFLRDALEKYGYKIILATDGDDAVRKYYEHKDHIGMVILDVIMPRKNGKEVYTIIRESGPDMKVLFMSGYTHDILTTKGVYEEELEFIAKPLDIYSLLKKVREMLNRQ